MLNKNKHKQIQLSLLDDVITGALALIAMAAAGTLLLSVVELCKWLL